jgi:hypothetical protein
VTNKQECYPFTCASAVHISGELSAAKFTRPSALLSTISETKPHAIVLSSKTFLILCYLQHILRSYDSFAGYWTTLHQLHKLYIILLLTVNRIGGEGSHREGELTITLCLKDCKVQGGAEVPWHSMFNRLPLVPWEFCAALCNNGSQRNSLRVARYDVDNKYVEVKFSIVICVRESIQQRAWSLSQRKDVNMPRRPNILGYVSRRRRN